MSTVESLDLPSATVITLPGVKLPAPPPAELPIIEPAMAPEFFCANLARVSEHGPFVRLVWSTLEYPLGRYIGIISYQAVLGQTIQVPAVVACDITFRSDPERHPPAPC